MLHAAIVGLGRWGQTLVDSAQGRSRALRFVAGATGRPEKAAEYAARQGIRLCRSLEEVLALDEVEAVVLATPHAQHAHQIVQAAAAGRHVFVEKPMTLTRADAAAAQATACAAGVVLAVGHNRRFLPAYRALGELAASELGTPLQLVGNFSWASHYPKGAWRAAPEQSPAGGMTGLGIHMLDAMVGLGHRARRVSVTTRRRVFDNGMDDTVTALIDFAGGELGVLTTMIGTARTWRLEIFGTGGWAAMDGEERLVHAASGQPLRTWEFPHHDIERAELEAFADAAAGRAPYPVTAEEALHGVAVFEAVCRAAVGEPGPVRSEPVA